MGHQIIRQSNGQFCIFSSYVGRIVVFDASGEEVVDYFAHRAAQEARRTTQSVVDKVASGRARLVYHQFTMSYGEALDETRRNGLPAEAGGG